MKIYRLFTLCLSILPVLLISACAKDYHRLRYQGGVQDAMNIVLDSDNDQMDSASYPALDLDRRHVEVALLVPLSGRSRNIGKSMRDAAQMALFEVGNPNISLRIFDTKGTPEGTVGAAKLALKHKVSLVLGPLYSGSTEAITPLLRDAGVPIISFSNNSRIAGDGVYVIGFTPEEQIRRVVDFAIEQGYQKFASLVPANPYGNMVDATLQYAIAHAQSDAVDPENMMAIIDPSYTVNLNDPEEEPELIYVHKDDPYLLRTERYLTASHLLAADAKRAANALFSIRYDRTTGLSGTERTLPEAILLPEGGKHLLALAPYLRRKVRNHSVRLLGSGQWDDHYTLQQSKLVGAWFASAEPAIYANYEQRFDAQYGYIPERLGSLAYDAVALASAISGQRNMSKALSDPRGFVGVDGVFRLLETGKTERALAILEVLPNGKTKVIAPAPTYF